MRLTTREVAFQRCLDAGVTRTDLVLHAGSLQRTGRSSCPARDHDRLLGVAVLVLINGGNQCGVDVGHDLVPVGIRALGVGVRRLRLLVLARGGKIGQQVADILQQVGDFVAELAMRGLLFSQLHQLRGQAC